jgi:hypothetical protein
MKNLGENNRRLDTFERRTADSCSSGNAHATMPPEPTNPPRGGPISHPPKLYKNWRTGMYAIRVPIPGSRYHRFVSTGEREVKRARAVVLESGADRLILLANAQALTAKTISFVTFGRNFTCRKIFDLCQERLAIVVAPRSADT